MMDRLRLIHKDQRGLTLVELLIAIILAGIVTAGITMTVGHVFTWSTRTSSHMTAVRQVQSAGYWVSHDTLQARPPEDTGFPLTLRIPYRVGEGHESEEKLREVVYNVVGGQLRRTYEDEDSDPITTIVAQHIVDADFTEDNEQPGVYLFTVSAATGDAPTVTREYRIDPRPD